MYEDERLEALKNEIRTRLRPVCTNLSEESFEDLVNKIAEQARKELRPDPPRSAVAGRRSPDAGHRSPDTGRRTPDAERRSPDA